MTNLAVLRPTAHDRVIDLLAEVGLDVSDWANYAGGAQRAATNPRYCYEWCFVQENRPVVLNLWHRDLKRHRDTVFQRHNYLRWAREAQKPAWRTRALKMNFAVSTAWEESLPIRVILCDGVMRDRHDRMARASKVRARELDVVPWAITNYDRITGEVTITRGAAPSPYRSRVKAARRLGVDYPDELIESTKYDEGARTTVTVNAYERDPRARRDCLRYHGYRCAACNLLFEEMYGELGADFIHVHHVRTLARQAGRPVDPTCDLIPVCPNCHAMLHRKNPPFTPAKLRQMIARQARPTRDP